MKFVQNDTLNEQNIHFFIWFENLIACLGAINNSIIIVIISVHFVSITMINSIEWIWSSNGKNMKKENS